MRTVDKYASDMSHGRWMESHQGIAFDTNGDLQDGQHRLAAIVKSGVSVWMMVTTNAPVSNFKITDAIRPRTASDIIGLDGHKNSKLVSGIGRGLCCFAHKSWSMSPSSTTVVEILKASGNSADKIASLGAGTRIVRLKVASLSVLAFYHTRFPQQAEELAVGIQSVNGAPKTAMRAMSNWIAKHKNEGGGNGQTQEMFIMSSVIWHHHRGNQIEKLYGSEDAIDWLLSVNRDLVQKIKALI